MVLINTIEISPPLLNSSCAWSSDLEQLTALYGSPYTGAITTRSATCNGFKEDASNTVAFSDEILTTINSYGYSPHALSQYLEWVETILKSPNSKKPIIISIAASEITSLGKMLEDIQVLRKKLRDHEAPPGKCKIAVEFNASCPNIAKSTPIGYTPIATLFPLIFGMVDAFEEDPTLTIGLKMPPYVYLSQFTDFLRPLSHLVRDVNGQKRCPISFLTCTNTLGNALLFSSQTTNSRNQGLATEIAPECQQFAVPTAIGGLAGESLHPLSLGNVFTFRRLLDSEEYVEKHMEAIKIIGVGGVTSKEALERMKKAGAAVVGCATLFGKEGVRAFEMLGNDMF